MSSDRKRGFSATVRARVLAIALIPSLVLLSAGAGLSSYLIVSALQQRDRAELLGRGYQMAVPFMPAMSQERRASILAVAAPTSENREALVRARGDMDRLLAQFRTISTQVAETMPAEAKRAIGEFVGKLPKIFSTRADIDAGKASRLEVYRAYSDVADAMIIAAAAIGHDSTDKEVALQRTRAADLMRASDWLDRSTALAAGALAGDGMTHEELHEYNRLTQGYQTSLEALAPRLGEQRAQLTALYSSPAWQRLSAVESALVEHGLTAAPETTPEVEPPTLPVSVQEWQDAAHHSATTLSSMGLGELGTRAAQLEADKADTNLMRALVAAGAMLVVVAVVLIIAIRIGNRLVRRLVRLRTETLRLADERLPQVVERLREGEQIDVAAELPELDHGRDEIGQVAAAFNKAQQTAIEAAVQEAKTREGSNAVFLNIARRSQAIVHRQLQVLDTAERATDDPDQLELLFQLDHLTTRERRNAENLIILGGGQLGRQWRNAVSLVELVRSAVAEAEQYTRVTITYVPYVLVDGRAVADLIHLLAELIDNATSFSPPGSRIEVRGNPVGKGVVIEVEDQGLGIEPERRRSLNEMFRNPPDFGFMALSDDARIGFFVVAHLAHQHDIQVTLQESAYGGVRAGVLVPSQLLTPSGEDGQRGGAHRPKRSGVEQTSPSLPRIPVVSDGPLPPQSAETGPSPTGSAGNDPAGIGTAGNDPAGIGTAGNGAAGIGTGQPAAQRSPGADNRPALPRRRPQAHLAKQLLEPPTVRIDDIPEPDSGRAAQHAQDTLSAFQQGTQRGRVGADEPRQWTADE